MIEAHVNHLVIQIQPVGPYPILSQIDYQT